jgi:hypothetical protein
MPTRHTLPTLLLAALLAQGASAQTPAGPAQFIVPPSTQNQFLASVAMDGTGNLTFLWSDYLSGAVYTRRFSKDDVPLGPAVRLEPPRYGTWAGTVVANQRGDVLMTWSRGRGSGPAEFILRRTSPVLRTLTLKLKGAPDIAVDNKGNFVAIWVASTPDGTRVFGQRYNSDGTPRGPEFNAATSKTGNHTSPSVAMNPSTGEFVVVWEVRAADGTGLGVYGQRFGFTTGRQGSEFPIFVPPASERPSQIQAFAPQVARSARGGFVVIWRNPADEFQLDVLGQRYSATGDLVGDRLVIDENVDLPDSHPQIAMSPPGDFVVAWDDQGTSPQWFRLFDRRGTPAGPVVSQPGMGGAPYYGTGRVAYGWDGTFVYAWTNYNDEGDIGNTISFQRFSAE